MREGHGDYNWPNTSRTSANVCKLFSQRFNSPFLQNSLSHFNAPFAILAFLNCSGFLSIIVFIDTHGYSLPQAIENIILTLKQRNCSHFTIATTCWDCHDVSPYMFTCNHCQNRQDLFIFPKQQLYILGGQNEGTLPSTPVIHWDAHYIIPKITDSMATNNWILSYILQYQEVLIIAPFTLKAFWRGRRPMPQSNQPFSSVTG